MNNPKFNVGDKVEIASSGIVGLGFLKGKIDCITGTPHGIFYDIKLEDSVIIIKQLTENELTLIAPVQQAQQQVPNVILNNNGILIPRKGLQATIPNGLGAWLPTDSATQNFWTDGVSGQLQCESPSHSATVKFITNNCDCGGFKTYNSMSSENHSSWCSSRSSK